MLEIHLRIPHCAQGSRWGINRLGTSSARHSPLDVVCACGVGLRRLARDGDGGRRALGNRELPDPLLALVAPGAPDEARGGPVLGLHETETAVRLRRHDDVLKAWTLRISRNARSRLPYPLLCILFHFLHR